jgi:hypothetical protein
MNNIKLNPLTAKTGEDAYVPSEVTISQFWRMYLRLIFLLGQKVNQREEDVLVYIFSNNPNINHFVAPYSTAMMNELGFSNRSEITRLKKDLTLKEYIDKKTNIPIPSLLNLHKVAIQKKNITFVIPFTLI